MEIRKTPMGKKRFFHLSPFHSYRLSSHPLVSSFNLAIKKSNNKVTFFTWLGPKDIYLFSWITPLLKNKSID